MLKRVKYLNYRFEELLGNLQIKLKIKSFYNINRPIPKIHVLIMLTNYFQQK